MRLSIAAVASLLALASAQGLGGLPDCAKTCATSAIPQECGLDIKCICTASSFLNAITCCVASGCSKEDQKKTITFAKGICGTVGVTNIPDSAVCSSASASGSTTPTPTPTSKPTPPPTAAPSSSGGGNGGAGGNRNVRTTPLSNAPGLTRTEETTVTMPTQTSSSRTSSSASRTPEPSAAAGNKIGVGAGLGLALGVLGML